MDDKRIKKEESTYPVLFKEIDLIQSCINRMASNSFEIKKWTVGIVAILAGLLKQGGDTKDIRACLLFLMVIVMFWGLDAFFLKTEKLYRKKYAWVIQNRLKENADHLFDLNPYEEQMMLDSNTNMPCLFGVMFSKTLFPFYFVLAVFCCVIIMFL